MGGEQNFRTRNLSLTGTALLVLLALGLLSRVANNGGVPVQDPNQASVEIPANEKPLTETVDLSNGNVHLQIPIRAVTKKP